jgi:hypothetical protein
MPSCLLPAAHCLISLSSATQIFFKIDSLFEGLDFYTSLTRAHFKELFPDYSIPPLSPSANAFGFSMCWSLHLPDLGIPKGPICVLPFKARPDDFVEEDGYMDCYPSAKGEMSYNTNNNEKRCIKETYTDNNERCS